MWTVVGESSIRKWRISGEMVYLRVDIEGVTGSVLGTLHERRESLEYAILSSLRSASKKLMNLKRNRTLTCTQPTWAYTTYCRKKSSAISYSGRSTELSSVHNISISCDSASNRAASSCFRFSDFLSTWGSMCGEPEIWVPTSSYPKMLSKCCASSPLDNDNDAPTFDAGVSICAFNTSSVSGGATVSSNTGGKKTSTSLLNGGLETVSWLEFEYGVASCPKRRALGAVSSASLTSLSLSGEEEAVVEWRADMTFLSEGVNLVGNARRFEGDETGVTEAITDALVSHELGGTMGGGRGFKEAASTLLPNFRTSSIDKPTDQCFIGTFPFLGDGFLCSEPGLFWSEPIAGPKSDGLGLLGGGVSVGRASTSTISITSLFRFKTSELESSGERPLGYVLSDVADCDGSSVSFHTATSLLLTKRYSETV